MLIVWIEDLRRAEFILDSERESFWNAKYEVHVDLMEACKLVGETFGGHVSTHYLRYVLFNVMKCGLYFNL